MEETDVKTNHQELNPVEPESRVIDKRLQNNTTEYLIKWTGRNEKSWEEAESLNCVELIQAFEDEESEGRQVQPDDKTKHHQELSRELEAEQIIGCTDNRGFLQFLVKWKGVDKADLMSAREVKDKYPQIVQDFYQERLNVGTEKSTI